MDKSNFSDDYKRDAVAQITERGYPVSEISMRLVDSGPPNNGCCSLGAIDRRVAPEANSVKAKVSNAN